jgi:hypothetical protein
MDPPRLLDIQLSGHIRPLLFYLAISNHATG